VSPDDVSGVPAPDVRDEPFSHPVLGVVQRFQGRVVSLVTETVDVGGQVVERDVVRHPGAVAVVALDDSGRVLLVRQYRHPMEHLLWEVPAGLLDKQGEDPVACAHRELLEEGGVVAGRLEPLVTVFATPGGCDEIVQIFLARDVVPAPGGRVLTGEAEEADMPAAWLTLEQACDAVVEGRIHNAITGCALLAAERFLSGSSR
jgi:8-oxo-dGDP phosphatase